MTTSPVPKHFQVDFRTHDFPESSPSPLGMWVTLSKCKSHCPLLKSISISVISLSYCESLVLIMPWTVGIHASLTLSTLSFTTLSRHTSPSVSLHWLFLMPGMSPTTSPHHMQSYPFGSFLSSLWPYINVTFPGCPLIISTSFTCFIFLLVLLFVYDTVQIFFFKNCLHIAYRAPEGQWFVFTALLPESRIY